MTLEPVENAKLNFSDMPFEEAVEWAKKASGQSTASFADPLTYPGYKDVPVAYVFTEKDTTVWPEMQRAQIENIEQERGSKITVYPIATGHFPYISYPDIMVDAIEKATAEIERP